MLRSVFQTYNRSCPQLFIETHKKNAKDDIKLLYTVRYPLIEKDSIKRDGAIVQDRTFYIDGSNGKVTIEDYVELNSYLETEGEKKRFVRNRSIL